MSGVVSVHVMQLLLTDPVGVADLS
ncbi:uncharacterized protein METZ01_LOCUS277788 [marine metagenome]|uniref:Uncharacterized protein n=1 Tax=marine metagenome TaxID=408172 RepID=A0A382KJ04_9ZZZZ